MSSPVYVVIRVICSVMRVLCCVCRFVHDVRYDMCGVLYITHTTP